MTDSKELAHAPEAQPLASIENAKGMLAMIAEAARDPSVDADKMIALAGLATSLQDREAKAEFNRAKIAAIMEMPSISKRGQILNKSGGVQSRYSRFEDMHRAIMPILARHRLVLSFNLGSQGQMITVQPVLAHANGYVEEGGIMPFPIDTSGSKNSTQGAGSAASYGKRHQMKAVLNIIEDGEDLDGLGSLPSDQINDRQARILEETKAAHGEGIFDAYWAELPPRDRAWMVQSGRLAELTGEQPKLDAPRAPAKTASPPAQPAAAASPEPEAPPPRMTAQSWTDSYIKGLETCSDEDGLDIYMDEGREGVGKIQAKHPALYARIQAAHAAARARISGSPAQGEGQASANESPGHAGGGDSLFPGDE